MAANETRMLILGAVALFEPVNGYQIRRELLSWQVDRWAHTNPGSIYHALAAQTKQGNLVRHDLVCGGRDVAVYEITPEGRAELQHLLVEALERVDPVDRAAFTTAFGFYPLLPREQMLASLLVRQVALEDLAAEFATPPPLGAVPPHARRSTLLWLDLVLAELDWLRETIEQIRSGTLPADLRTWTPPPDDPGWQMSEEREHYLDLLDR